MARLRWLRADDFPSQHAVGLRRICQVTPGPLFLSCQRWYFSLPARDVTSITENTDSKTPGVEVCNTLLRPSEWWGKHQFHIFVHKSCIGMSCAYACGSNVIIFIFLNTEMHENWTTEENKTDNIERRCLDIQATIEILNFFNSDICARRLYSPFPFSSFFSLEKMSYFALSK